MSCTTESIELIQLARTRYEEYRTQKPTLFSGITARAGERRKREDQVLDRKGEHREEGQERAGEDMEVRLRRTHLHAALAFSSPGGAWRVRLRYSSPKK